MGYAIYLSNPLLAKYFQVAFHFEENKWGMTKVGKQYWYDKQLKVLMQEHEANQYHIFDSIYPLIK